MQDREILLKNLFDAAVVAVGGQSATETALRNVDIHDVYLVAVGKAAPSMAHGAVSAFGPTIRRGLIISKFDHIDDQLKNMQEFECIEASHPVPDQNSLFAGQRLREFVADIPASANVLFLTSGGASALVEALPDGLLLEDLQRANEYLLSTGLDIVAMNRIRKSFSTIKGGRLAGQLKGQSVLHLLISDVPGDSLTAIGSGLLVPPDQTEAASDLEGLPGWLSEMQSPVSAPPVTDPVWSQIDSRIIASNAIACAAVEQRAASLGLTVRLGAGSLDGAVEERAEHIASVLGDPAADAGVYIWGGETTVVLPANPGRGGRNQQLALELANRLKNHTDWNALCCGTDGTDGPTADAGGLVGPDTVANGIALGLDVDDALVAADAGSYLHQTGGLITTGPTGTNVMDLVIAIKG